MTLNVLHHLRFWASSFGLALLALALLTYNQVEIAITRNRFKEIAISGIAINGIAIPFLHRNNE